jgi:hypothetical protein
VSGILKIDDIFTGRESLVSWSYMDIDNLTYPTNKNIVNATKYF